jgi:hypothetical protein
MDAREIESLSMISRGFEELRDANPELAYNVILDLLSGINEWVYFVVVIQMQADAFMQELGRTSAHPDHSQSLPAQARDSPERTHE